VTSNKTHEDFLALAKLIREGHGNHGEIVFLHQGVLRSAPVIICDCGWRVTGMPTDNAQELFARVVTEIESVARMRREANLGIESYERNL